jgi:exodeoxyribonuclease V gamma subunit
VLHIHRAERADGLIEALRALLTDPLPDPFAPEVISVPTRGIERWLTQRMAARLGATEERSDGVCANVQFPPPRVLIGDAVAAASEIQPDEDPWVPARAVWSLLEVVDESLGEPWLRSLSTHLGGGEDPPDPVRRSRRFASALHLADLFDRYALYRPQMVRAWADGHDTDGEERSLPGDTVWQAELWRRLRERIAQPDPAERFDGACMRLRDHPGIVELPPRVSLFCLTRLPAGHLDALRALAAGRDVHLFLLHPSAALWDKVAATEQAHSRIVRRSDDVTAGLPDNRLLASWGHDACEMQLVIAGADDYIDHHHRVEDHGGTLLRQIQADVRADRSPAGAPLSGQKNTRPVLDADDHSVQIHACHGRARQVEVLRDAILHMLEEDSSLEPRDIVVMCPDIETFAPLIQATFGAADTSGDDELEGRSADVRPPDLRVRLADRSLRQTNPVLSVVSQLFDLAGRRLTASQVLDLADREPVRRRFRLDDNDLTRIQRWVAESGIRWGLDAPHRAPFKLEELAAGTWHAGVDRILVGVTMTEDDERLFGGVLPLDDVDSGTIDLAGRFAEFIERIRASLDSLSTAKTIDAWAVAIAAAADALTTTGPYEEWQRSELQRLLDDVVEEATTAESVNPTFIDLPEVRALLGTRLRGRPTRANFRTGQLTICTLVPMRSVPHRVVCLLGLDDGAFPRKAPRDGDNLLLEDPHVGDPDSRTEDRQILLDALLAATDRLLITYTGNDERTNLPLPPAVPVGELLDLIDRTTRIEGSEARSRVVVRHPLQPFDPRNFTAGELVGERSWSFDRVALGGAIALNDERAEAEPFLSGPLPDVAAALVEIDDLVRFFERPIRAFLRQRLGVSLRPISEEVGDALPVELDHLEKWAVGQRLLQGRLAGADMEACIAAESSRGTLPAGSLAIPVIEGVRPTVEAIAASVEELFPGTAPGSVDVRVLLAAGRSLGGTVPQVRGDVLCMVTYSKVTARQRLAAWVRLLAFTAAHPERPFEAVTIGRARSGATGALVTVATLPALASDERERREIALDQLATLLDIYDRGMREPLPLACFASAAYASAAAAGENAEKAGREAWESNFKFDREDRELEHLFALGGEITFSELLADSPRPDEQGNGWDATETTRFGRYARRLWSGPLAHEAVVDR